MYRSLPWFRHLRALEWLTDLARIFREGNSYDAELGRELHVYRRCCTFKVAGKVGYSILPYGEVRSANIWDPVSESINLLQKTRRRQHGCILPGLPQGYAVESAESPRRWLPSYEKISL